MRRQADLPRLNHVAGIYFFTSGFLLTRLVLDEESTCTEPPLPVADIDHGGKLTHGSGCWHPKTFDRAVVIIIDALRYDFTVPFDDTPAQAFHNSIPFLYETAMKQPGNAFLRPFIADPPTTTLQRLKGLTTGTLPTFIDAGSNFAGTAIEEDNLLLQLRKAGRKLVHLGDDTWTALFPDSFEQNISRAYDSLNVWDLHTVDNGVIEHIFPLLQDDLKPQWDVMFAHFLGVDHAGHRYGPNHPAMTSKLKQMDDVLRDVVAALDDKTLLVVMGDHGMDGKGDHGGESDDEVEAALWMYSKNAIFGRTDPSFVAPPTTAKIRPVNQIDLVPTLALLLGIPIPFNNLGAPIEEAFTGAKHQLWDNLSRVSRLANAGIRRYQSAYNKQRGEEESVAVGSPHALWQQAEESVARTANARMTRETYEDLAAFQKEALRLFRAQWSRFDVRAMVWGIAIMAAGLLGLLLHASANATIPKDKQEGADGPELLKISSAPTQGSSNRAIVLMTTALAVLGALLGYGSGIISEDPSLAKIQSARTAAMAGTFSLLFCRRRAYEFAIPNLRSIIPDTAWGWFAVVFTISQSLGFASNSYTIWEDSILLYFISTVGLMGVLASLRLDKTADRALGVYHSVAFTLLGWVASFSKLCREEQMPYCRSTYYASATSSTSAPWQLLIPLFIAAALPAIIKSYFAPSRSYEGFAPAWIGWALRVGLVLNALFWIIDAADDGDWFPSLAPTRLKSIRVPIALTILAMSLLAGPVAFRIASPCISIRRTEVPSSPTGRETKPTIVVLGYGNAHGTLYLLLPLALFLSLLLVQKPMGQAALSLFLWQALSLVEVLDLTSLGAKNSAIGPVAIALLASFHFFKTGHQHVLSSIQWETAFIPFYSLIYPWSPLLIAWNTFGAAILGTALLPLTVLWKRAPREPDMASSVLRDVSRQLAVYLAYWTTIALATMCWAGWLRRHLMLYRIFSPRFMGAVTALMVVDLVAIAVVLWGTRTSILGVAKVFGFSR